MKDDEIVLSLRRLERKFDLLLAHLGAQSEMADDLGEVRDLVQRGRKIHAIKRYRELRGGGLKEAKNAVDRMERGY